LHARVGGVLSLFHALVGLASAIPRAVGPLPETIDLSTPFAIAGAGGVIGGLVRPGATAVQRDLYARRWSLSALVGGFALYGFVVMYQLLSKA
jgi:hypothetical protein